MRKNAIMARPLQNGVVGRGFRIINRVIRSGQRDALIRSKKNDAFHPHGFEARKKKIKDQEKSLVNNLVRK